MVASMARESALFSVGHILGNTYRIERKLGQGGMASVFEVSHVRLPRRFALKVITAPDAQSPDFMLRFRREAEILGSLDHPNLVNVVDWNTTPGGQPYLVMELLCGEDLSELLRRSGALPPRMALSIFAQAAAALQVAHSNGITHRDLKPANLFLCKNGLVPHYTKVLDFGIAKIPHGESGALITDHLVLMGTPAYMAPEQARGDMASLDARADQFSLALVLYEMLSGKAAFYRPGEPLMSTLCRVLTEDPAPLPDAAMNRALMRALCKEPQGRYPILGDLVKAVMAASALPPELIEVPERTDKVSLGVRSSGLSTASPEMQTQRPSGILEHRSALIPTGLGTSGSAQEQPPEPNAAVPPPVSLMSNRSGELLARDQRPGWRLRHAGLGGAGLILLVAGLKVAGLHSETVSLPDMSPGAAADMSGLADMSVAEDLAEQDKSSADLLAVPSNTPVHLDEDGDDEKELPQSPKRRTRIELQLSGVTEKSAHGKVVLRCVRSIFGPNDQRRLVRTPLWLGRGADRFLHVVSPRLQGELNMQLEQCLSALNSLTTNLPSRIDITFVEAKVP